MTPRRTLPMVAGALALASTVVLGKHFTPGTVPGTFQGPTSSATPYAVPAAAGWETISLLTVGDFADEVSYQMVGIPDGLGAMAGKEEGGKYVADKAYMTVFMNHELGATAGAARAHGNTGAFQSQWTVHLNSLSVKWGEDLIKQLYLWNGSQYYSGNGAAAGRIARLCSADLPLITAFYNPQTGAGFNGRIVMAGEETGAEGRAFASVVSGSGTGTTYELPYLGKMSWENAVAHPNAGNRTIVVALDDSTPGQVYVYVGTKQSAGTPIQQAGLEGGSLYGIKVTNGGPNYGGGAVPTENAGAISGVFALAEIPGANNVTGAVIQTTSTALGVTNFARPEDGAWDPNNPNVFYFVTTGASGQSSRLYKLTFNSLSNPTSGAIQLVVDRAALLPAPPAGAAMFDNMTVDQDGLVLIQEDPGNNPYLARTWVINPAVPAAQTVLVSDSGKFSFDAPNGLTDDEESSGIIEVTDIVSSANWYEAGRRYYLAAMQAHYAVASPLVEGGQLYLIASPRR